MKTMIDNLRGRTAAALLVPVLLAAGMFLGGCESDATAPQDLAPALTEQDAANQAGYAAFAVAQVGPKVVTYSPSKQTYQLEFPDTGPVSGKVSLDFRLGGSGGTPATYSAGNWARLYTADGQALAVAALVGTGNSALLTFDITADINNQSPKSAVLDGVGTFQTGVHQGTFSITHLSVTAAAHSYPTGAMSFTGGGFASTVTFNGTVVARITVTGHPSWSFNLVTGALTPLV
jgi:hypothetical protein